MEIRFDWFRESIRAVLTDTGAGRRSLRWIRGQHRDAEASPTRERASGRCGVLGDAERLSGGIEFFLHREAIFEPDEDSAAGVGNLGGNFKQAESNCIEVSSRELSTPEYSASESCHENVSDC